jgi:putative ABC transport system ATP-binding protein
MELKFSGLNKTFRGIEGEPDFSLDVPPLSIGLQKVVFIMGHNGSGKSVLLRLMVGELLPNNGAVRIELDGDRWLAHERPCAIVRQEAERSLALDLTVRENLLLRVKARSFLDSMFSSRRLARYAKEIVANHEMMHRKFDQPVRNLSAGQRQTLAFLAVASQQRPALFLDEFLASTDQGTSRELRNLARSYAENVPACVFVVSHDIRIAMEDADQILVLRGGSLIRSMTRQDEAWSEASLFELVR